MTIWVETIRDRILGRCYAISCEYHDAYVYTADNEAEAVKKYEADKHVKVSKVVRVEK